MNNTAISQDWAAKGRILTGTRCLAQYRQVEISDYAGNPWIEALPPFMREEEAILKIRMLPSFTIPERELPTEIRGHCIQRLTELIVPLSRHILLEQAVSRAIRGGYKARNPLSAAFYAKLREDEDAASMSIAARCQPCATGFALFGYSGIGKSTAMERILLTYPQVISHTRYNDKPLNFQQVVWLKLDCPHDGSLRALCLDILAAFDSALGKEREKGYLHKYGCGRKTIDEMVGVIRHLAWIHALGILVIDEIQNLSHSKSGGPDNMLNFFVSLVNTLGVPVVPIGTVKAIRHVTKQFRNARRATGQGDMFWDQLSYHDEWELFTRALWKYQWLDEPAELTSEFQKVLFEESGGITDIAVKLYMFAQYKAIFQGVPTITPEFIREVAGECLRLIQPMIQALTNRDNLLLAKYEDLYVQWTGEMVHSLARKPVITSTSDFDPAAADTGKILDWLVRAGIEHEVAVKAAEEVVREGHGIDLPSLMRKAFARVGELKAGKAKRKRVEPKYNAGDLRLVGKQAKSGELVSELLRDKGIIEDSEV